MTPPKGDLSIPASVTSGATTYEVTSIAKNAFANCPELTSISLPTTLREVDPDAVAGCPSLKSITVSAKNEAFASHDGMLFTKDYSRLLLIPEGKEGAATIPGQTTYVPAQAFSRCLSSSLTAGDGSAEFTTLNGMLFTKDLKTLVVCPPKAENAVVLPTETEAIGEYALAGCKDLTSITALGNVHEIDETAFADETKETAVVAIPVGEDYDARKVVWEQASFQHFAEPAEPGATTRPDVENSSEAVASGFVFTLLDDYTLSATWEGTDDPEADLEIPASAEINGVSYRVSAIAANAFANRGSLTSVKLPESITTIGEAAFEGCANLADIQLSGNLREIGERAFEATALTDVWLPASVQSINSRAFASCESLTRIVALDAPLVADDTLAGCANLSIYCPYNAEGYPWNLGLLANNNHLLPYGLALPEELLTLEVGESANLFENALHEVPEGCEVSYSYAAKPISVDPDGTVTGKAPGTSEVTATLTLNNIELSRTTRTVEVTAVPEVPKQPSDATDSDESFNASDSTLNTSQYQVLSSVLPEVDTAPALFSADSATEHISLTAALATGETFKATASTGQILTCTVLADEPGSVEIALADESKPTDGSIVGGIVIPAIVIDPNTGTEYVVKGIGEQAFGDTTLTSISFEAGSQVSYIGEMAFNACKLLNTVLLPASLQTIAPKAFGYCFSLATLEIPDSVTSIGINAFQSCVSLSYVSVGVGVTALSDSLFCGDFNLKTLVMRGSIETFGVELFQDTRPSNLMVYVPSAADKATWENANQNGLYGLTPSNIVVAVEFQTVSFKDCGENGEEVVIRVAKGEAVEMPPASKQGFGLAGWYEDSSFAGDRWDFSQPIERDITLHPRWVESFVQDGLEFTMRPDGNGVAVGAVNPASMTGNLMLPDTVAIAGTAYPVTAIASNGFALSAIDSVVLPSSLESIEVSAFNTSSVRTTNLGSLAKLKKIAAEAFIKTNLTELVIPASVETIQRAAFHSCKALESVMFAEGSVLTIIPDECFYQCTSMKSALLPASLKCIEYNAFFNNASLAAINLPEGLEFIGSFAFFWSKALRSVVLPSTVTSVGPSAFASGAALVSVALPSGLRTLGSDAFKGCPALNTLSVNSSMTAIADALKPSSALVDAFTGLTKANITVVLPTASEDGSETYKQMKEAWEGYGFSKFSPMSGPLPTEGNADNADPAIAGWRLTSDGTLTIWCAPGETIADLGWSLYYNTATADNVLSAECFQTHWGLTRDLVKRVVMQPNVKTSSMACWFGGMNALEDASGVYVPDGVSSVAGLFFGCTSLKSLSTTLSLPSGITSVDSFCQGCTALRVLPAGFTLPDTAVTATQAFNHCGSLIALPQGFTFPEGFEDAFGMFANCPLLHTLPESFILPTTIIKTTSMFFGSGLISLPMNFTIPKSLEDASYMFNGCSLTSLPEGFTIPLDGNMKTVQGMFGWCNNLTYLPESFDFPGYPLDTYGMFSLSVEDSQPLLKTFYFGKSQRVKNLAWDSFKRQLITSSANIPVDMLLVDFVLPNNNGEYAGDPWVTVMTAADGKISEMSAPQRADGLLQGWYVDTTCKTPFDFSKTVAEQMSEPYVLYAKYQSNSGSLPTTDNGENASWEFTEDGTLVISCNPGATIASLGWDPLNVFADREGTWSDVYWGPWRNHVKRIEMTPGVKAEDMICWFAEMHNLVDMSGVYVPQGVDKLNRLFFRCTKLENIADGFTFPEGVSDASDAFGYCSALKYLPNGFSLPGTTRNAGHLFDQCPQLEHLPASFLLPEGLEDASCMFGNCSNLKSLPVGFTLPETVTSAAAMFLRCSSLTSLPVGFKISSKVLDMSDFMSNCTALESLPEGFTVPSKATKTARMFGSCTSLKSLPESFTIPESVNNISQMFYNCQNLTVLPASLNLSVLSSAAKETAKEAFIVPGNGEPVVTVYAGTDLSHLSLNGGDAVEYWRSTFKRSLYTMDNKPETIKTVSFMVADYKTGQQKTWMTVAADGGVVKRPTDPAQFGYAFDGWYTDPGFAADSKVAFAADGTAPVDSDLPLYGRFILSIDIDVPLAAKVEVDSSGNVTPAIFKMRSNTPVALSIASVSSEAASGAEKLFPNADERAGVQVQVKMNGAVTSLVFGESKGPLSSLSAATVSSPTMIDAEIGLDRKGAQLNFQPGEDITSFAKLTWTIVPES